MMPKLCEVDILPESRGPDSDYGDRRQLANCSVRSIYNDLVVLADGSAHGRNNGESYWPGLLGQRESIDNQ